MICSQCGCQNPPYMEFCQQCASEFPSQHNAAPERPRTPLRPVPAPAIEDARRQRVYEPAASQVVIPMDPKPYDYRLPYRPAREMRVSQYAQPRSSARTLDTYPIPIQNGYYPESMPQRMPARAEQGMPQHSQQQIPRQMQGGQAYMGARAPQPSYPPMPQGAGYAMPSQWYAQEMPGEAAEAAKIPGPQRVPVNPGNAAQETYEDTDEQETPKKRNVLRFVLFAAIIILLGATVYFGINYINSDHGSIAAFVENIFNPTPASPSPTPLQYDIVAKATEYEGKPAHVLTYSGKEGEFVRLDDYNAQPSGRINGVIPFFTIIDTMLIPQTPDPDKENIDVVVNATLLDKDGNEIRKLSVEPIPMTVPKIDISLTAPDAPDATVESAQVDIAGALSIKARLTIDDVDISQRVGADGKFTYSVQLPDYGQHTVTIVASADHYREGRLVLNLDYPKKDIEMTIDEKTIARTQKATAEVKGTVEPGAQLTLEGEHEGDLKLDTSTGEFSFVAKLTNLGLNTFTLTASKDGIETPKVVTVEKIPERGAYTSQALKMDYANLSKNAAKQKGKIYQCIGKVISISQSDPYYVFTLDVGSSGKEQLIVMEYYGTTQIEEDSNFNIFGDVEGLDEESGLPKIIARFVYVPNT